MSENSQLPVVFSDAQRDIILMQTPPNEIKQRPGRGGQPVNYVEVGYVVETLNIAFGFDWDFEIVQHTFLENAHEVCVLGRLTARAGGHAIVKQQFGGAEVKYLRGSKTPVSLADDFKAAASDALKKCASLLGVAHDVYRGEVATPGGNGGGATETKTVPAKRKAPAEKPTGTGHWIDDPTTRKQFWAYAKSTLGLTEAQVHEALQVTSLHEFLGTKQMAKSILDTAAGELAFDKPSEMEY